MSGFSLARTAAVFIKEFQQMLRDRLTFAMAVFIPVLQLVLFGYAINTDPKNLPAAVVAQDSGPLTRSLVTALQNTGYFRVVASGIGQAQADALLARGDVQFVVVVPPRFERDLLRGQRPVLYVAVDATDPTASATALAALSGVAAQALAPDLVGPLRQLQGAPPPYEVRIHRRYNPEGLSRLNIVPGLIGTILTMTMVMLTALAMTRERERGTMENLLAMPVKPIEVMAGKIAPYIIIGGLQVAVVLAAAKVLFGVPFVGSFTLFGLATLLFITVNLAIGFTFSTIAQNQLQAVQMSFFFLMPAILLTGFAFPFRGMPVWAQMIGEILPATHFLRIVRGIMLKGASFGQIAPEIAVLLLTLVIVAVVAVSRYRVTLD